MAVAYPPSSSQIFHYTSVFQNSLAVPSDAAVFSERFLLKSALATRRRTLHGCATKKMAGVAMSILKRRTKLVSFRLSDEEYKELQGACVAEGARSISDFARAALQRSVWAQTQS